MGDMAGVPARRGGRARIGDEAKGAFLDALRRGARHEEAARGAGFSRSAFFRLRSRDPAFATLWEEAIDYSSGPRYLSPGAGRRLQLRRNRSVRFTEQRREIFLARFAGTCNLTEAADAAGVCIATVFAHRAKHEEFAARFQQALDQGYALLEAELVRRRLEGQQGLSAVRPTGDPEPEFDRALKLLQRWDRGRGGIGLRTVAPGRQQRSTFEEAIEALDRKLAALKIPILGEP